MNARETTMNLSVVIPAHNAAAHLKHLLAAIQVQLAAGDECILVDDGSTDCTRAIAAAHSVKMIVQALRLGPAAARNLGAREAHGEVLVFLDADVVPHGDVLSRIRSHFETDPSLAAVIGSYDAQPTCRTTVSRLRNLLHCYMHRTGKRDASFFWAGCGAMRRQTFEAFRGFDEHRFSVPSIEDVELGMRLRRAGHSILLDPELQVQHRKAWTLASMLHTDLWHRAVPWSTLILESRQMPADLNIKVGQRFSAAGTALAAAMLLLLLWVPFPAAIASATLAAAVILGNLNFYRFLAKYGSWWFAVRSIPLHLLYFLCAAFGFLISVSRSALRELSSRL